MRGLFRRTGGLVPAGGFAGRGGRRGGWLVLSRAEGLVLFLGLVVALAAVVGDIEPGAFEQQAAAPTEQPLKQASTLRSRTFRQRLGRDRLKRFVRLAALLTLILIRRHLLTRSRQTFWSILRGAAAAGPSGAWASGRRPAPADPPPDRQDRKST